MPSYLLLVLTLMAAALALAGVYSFVTDLYLRDRALVRRRLDDEFRGKLRDRAKKSPLFKDLAKVAAELPAEATPHRSMVQGCQRILDQSGVRISLQRLLLVAAALGLGLGGLGGIFRKSILVGAILTVVGLSLPIAYVIWRRRAKMDKLLAQLPDALELMARVIRVGQTPSRAMHAVAEEFDEPISAEFAYCYEQQNLGLSSAIVLRDLAERNGVLELHIFVIAMLVQQQTGGSLAELLENLAAVVRERLALHDKVKTLTAEGRMQALVLMLLPPVMLGLMFVVNRGYAMALFDNPKLIMMGLASMAVGALWIRKIVNFEV